MNADFLTGVSITLMVLGVILSAGYLINSVLRGKDFVRKLKLRLKFKRKTIDCPRCQGQGQVPAQGLGNLPTLDFECVGCNGSGRNLIYTYRFKRPRTFDEFEADHTEVEEVLGGVAYENVD